MKWYSPLLLLVSQTAVAVEEPKIDPLDERFLDYRPPGPDDVRSPCPGLNALANHGFLPRSGKNVNIVDVILGTFFGLGVSPETSGVIVAVGLASSHNPLTLGFNLDDLAKHLFLIEHDNSFSREDALVGDNNSFNDTLWNVALSEMIGHDLITPSIMGRAKAKRVADNKQRNPETVYGVRAVTNGALEVGLVLSAMGSPIPLVAKLEYVRSIFEEERLPYHLGWRPGLLAVNAITVVAGGIVALLADPDLVEHAADLVLDTPSDLLQTFVPPEADFLAELSTIITNLGFPPDGMNEVKGMLANRTH